MWYVTCSNTRLSQILYANEWLVHVPLRRLWQLRKAVPVSATTKYLRGLTLAWFRRAFLHSLCNINFSRQTKKRKVKKLSQICHFRKSMSPCSSHTSYPAHSIPHNKLWRFILYARNDFLFCKNCIWACRAYLCGCNDMAVAALNIKSMLRHQPFS